MFHRQPAVFHLTNAGRTIFAQLLDFLPKYEFDKCVEHCHGNFRLRKLPTYEQLYQFSKATGALVGRRGGDAKRGGRAAARPYQKCAG